MRKSFAHNPGPLVIGVIRERNVRDAIAAIKNAALHGATGIDLHLSCLDEDCKNRESIAEIVNNCDLPILALNYNQTYDYKGYDTDEESRIELLLTAVEAGVAAIDMQAYSYDLPSKYHFREEFKDCGLSFTKGDPKEIVVDEAVIEKQKALIQKVHDMGAEVLISCHPMVPMNSEQVTDLAKHLYDRGPDVIKIVTWADTEADLHESIRSILKLKETITDIPVHCHAAGKAGQLSRVINPILGGYLLFCNDGFTASSNFSQPDLQTVRSIIDNVKKTL